MLLVTHDHDVIDEVATRIWNFKSGRIEDFKGPYADYLASAQRKKPPRAFLASPTRSALKSVCG